MKIAILTMFTRLTTTYSLVNVVADHIQMLLDHGIAIKLLVSEACPDTDRFGVYLDPRIEWVKITNQYQGQTIIWHDYTSDTVPLHKTFHQEARHISQAFTQALQDVSICMLHDILYQGWHYLHNQAIRLCEPALPHVHFVAFTHSFPVNRPTSLHPDFTGRYTGMPRTHFA